MVIHFSSCLQDGYEEGEDGDVPEVYLPPEGPDAGDANGGGEGGGGEGGGDEGGGEGSARAISMLHELISRG
jgi:hypothetical protein